MNLLRRPLLPRQLAITAIFFSFAAIAQAQTPRALYVVAVGISQYQSPGMNLQSASKDALDVANTFRKQQGKLFSYVEVNTLTDQQATAANIRSTLSQLRHKATADSYVILYLAGHGNNGFAGEYHFQAYDYQPLNPGKTTICWREFQEVLSQMPGKVIVIMDSCRSGAVGNGSNLIVFCSSLAHQNAGESPQNGFFTQALLEALSGRADTNKNNVVTLAELDAYVSERLEQLSFGMQQASVARPPNVPSTMPIASLNAMHPTLAVTAAPPAVQVTPWTAMSPAPGSLPAVTSSGPLPENQGAVIVPAQPPLNIQSSGPLRR